MPKAKSSLSEKDGAQRGTNRRALLRQATALVAGTTAASLGKSQTQETGGAALRMYGNGFKASKVQTSGATINVVSGGQGPGLLLLHGAPQSLASWYIIAPKLARDYTVVAADLRGYGDSSKPEGGENHINYSKRSMALDGVEVMKHFGFEKFAVVGHDRGGRVAHRLTLDHPDKVTKVAVLDIVPTRTVFKSINKELATSYYHWFFLIQPAPFPETLINNSIEFYMGRSTSETQKEFLRCFRDPATVHGMCEDYRAGASIDLQHDEADLNRKIACPLLALWAANGNVGKSFDVLAVWRERASKVSGKALPGGHTLQESAPNETLAELQAFLRA
jgi:haloacetate dehalogenase